MRGEWKEVLSGVCTASQVHFDLPMKEMTSMRVGGPCDAFVSAKSEEDMLSVLRFAREREIPLFVMGKGSNLIVRDGGMRGIVLHCDLDTMQVRDRCMYSGAGVKLPNLAREAIQKNLAGLEFAQGIPGSVGGGISMNAGAYGGQMSDVLQRVRYIDESLSIEERQVEEGDFAYRSSVFSRNGWIVLSAELLLERDMDGGARKRFDEYRQLRRQKQPLEYPSAGSVFKRPEGHYAGTLIQEAGLKGLRIGGAVVSQKHAGFIINDQNATAEDVISLIAEVQKRVLDHSGVVLECEVKILGQAV